MNKQQLVQQVAKSTGMSKADVDKAIKGILYNIALSLSKGEKVTFVGFGTFERRQRKGRIAVNPRNPVEKIKVPPKKAATFSAGTELKCAVESGKPPKLSMQTLSSNKQKSQKNSKIKKKLKK